MKHLSHASNRTISQHDEMMSSKKIAELTSKEHKHVLRDIRNMIDQIDGTDLYHPMDINELRDSRGYTSELLLNEDLTLLLATGYSVPLRKVLDQIDDTDLSTCDYREGTCSSTNSCKTLIMRRFTLLLNA